MTSDERRRCSLLVVRPRPCRMEAREALGAPPGPPSREDGRPLSTALPRTPGRCRPLPLRDHEPPSCYSLIWWSKRACAARKAVCMLRPAAIRPRPWLARQLLGRSLERTGSPQCVYV